METLLHNLSDYYDGSLDPAYKIGISFAIALRVVNWFIKLFRFAFGRYLNFELSKFRQEIAVEVIKEIKKLKSDGSKY